MAVSLPRFEKNRKHAAKDWLGLSIIAAAGIIAALFVLTQLTHYLEGMAMEQFSNQLDSTQARYEYAKAHSTSTPEKTYEAFRQALLNNDLEGALKWIAPSAKKDYEDGIRKAYQEGKFQTIAQNLKPIHEVWSADNSAYYEYVAPPQAKPGTLSFPTNDVSFARDMDGLWKIDAI